MREPAPPAWHLLEDNAHSAALNMATDEALLQCCRTLGGPVLRFYGWTEGAASFGYFQHYRDVETMTALRPLVRRPTGGGLVPHDADWTYSLVFPPEHPWYRLKATESYKRLHEWVQASFIRRGVLASLAMLPRKTAPGQCFAGPEQFDVVLEGRKVAGAAQRRTRQGLLIQGSVQAPQHESRPEWQGAMCDVAAEWWGISWRTLAMTPELSRLVEVLAATKYGVDEYNRRR